MTVGWALATAVALALGFGLAALRMRNQAEEQQQLARRAAEQSRQFVIQQEQDAAKEKEELLRAQHQAGTLPSSVLEHIRSTLGQGAEGLSWTITATEMQSHQKSGETRSGPYRILQSRGENAVQVESIDEGKPKIMVIRRDGDRMRIDPDQSPPHPLHIEVPGYYRRADSPTGQEHSK
jgi:hypothetical protein